jgi:pimeloyl-ACP methyl ester carboxylesterase
MHGRLALGAGMLFGLAYDANRRAAQAELENPPMGRMIDLSDGSRLHYVERGSGPPVLLIHGALMQAEDMAMSLLGPLSERYRTIVIDRPGHGYSTRPGQLSSPHAASMAAQARMIHEAMRIIGVEKPIIVGHSLGGTVALAYAVQFPEHISGIVSLAGYCFPTPRFDLMPIMLNGVPVVGPISAHTVSAVFGRLYLSAMISRIFAPNPIPNYFQERFPGGMLLRPRQLCANGEDFSAMVTGAASMYHRYHQIQVPVAILSGTEDKIVWPQYHGKPLQKIIADATLEMLPGVGHMLHHIKPDAVIAAVHRMAERVDERAREFALAG